MFVRAGKMLVIVALVATTGAQWVFLQTVAWTSMLAGNLRNESFSTAVTHTFDGRHLCPLCRAIAASKKSGRKSEALSSSQKLEFPPVPDGITLIAPAIFHLPGASLILSGLPPQKPPLPPPRSLPA